jgi:mono/diheme cytochrome c family protein
MGITSKNESMMKTTKLFQSLAVSAVLAGSISSVYADRGAQLFEQNCAVCHGSDGNPSPVGLALKARNFNTEPFKQGDDLASITKTLETGVPGTGMVSFGHFSLEDRQLMAQQVLNIHSKYKTQHSGASTSPVVPVVDTVTQAIATVVDSAKAKVVTPVVASVQSHTAPVATPVESNAPAVAVAAAPTTDPVIDMGRKLYKSNGCAGCHGENGQADTATGMALKARNFVEGNYKSGGTAEGIIGVLRNGVPGTAMVAFPALAEGEKGQALATFLLALKGHPEVADSPNAAPPAGSGKISVAYAMKLLAVTERYPINQNFMDDSAGSKIYSENCASCHGVNGQGGIATRFISTAPYYRVQTAPLLGHEGYWLKTEAAFTKLVTEGLPGKTMPGQGTLTKQQMQDLFQFFKACKEQAKN